MQKLLWGSLLATAFMVSMEDPAHFINKQSEKREKCLIISHEAQQRLNRSDTSLSQDTTFPLPTRESLELDACGMSATMVTTSCCLHVICNTDCRTGLLLGACSYLALSCLIADETDKEWVTECYTGRASVYLKKKIAQKSNSILSCLAPKSAKKQE